MIAPRLGIRGRNGIAPSGVTHCALRASPVTGRLSVRGVTHRRVEAVMRHCVLPVALRK